MRAFKGCVNKDCKAYKRIRYRKEDKFCVECGQKLEYVCADCWTPLKNDKERYCKDCLAERNSTKEMAGKAVKKAGKKAVGLGKKAVVAIPAAANTMRKVAPDAKELVDDGKKVAKGGKKALLGGKKLLKKGLKKRRK